MRGRSGGGVVAGLGLGALLLGAACGGAGGAGGDCEGLVAGDLVITEVMANPAGEDAGKEWFEIYNATGAPLDLAGVVLVASRSDGTDEKTHVVGTLAAATDGYVVVGGVVPELLPTYVDYGYGSALGSLRNSAGRLAVRCGDTEVDRVEYGELADGVAEGLTGASPPDHTLNDDQSKICPATVEFEPESLGSPGAANEICPEIGPPGMCDDLGTPRPTDGPVAGDLVLTEVLPDPSVVGDDLGEWFEVTVNRAVDLNGLAIANAPGEADTILASASCLRAEAGTRLLFAHVADSAMNGGLPPVDHRFDSPGLSNSGGTLVLSFGGALIDQITWTSARAGRSIALDPDLTDAGLNDDPASFCAARDGDTYGDGDRGTPGAENPQCPVIAPEGMCDDGGALRPIVAPAPGQLVLTELMANPDAPLDGGMTVSDGNGEWFELHATADVDLNGLEIGKTFPTVSGTITSPTCLRAAAGTHVVLAQTVPPETNGGIVGVLAAFPTGVSLANTASGLFVASAGVLVDELTYATADVRTGVAWQLDADFLTAADNDVAANLCPATTPIGALADPDLGTPGAANIQCP